MSIPPDSAPAWYFTQQVLEPLKSAFVGKEEIIDLLGVALVGGENLFLLGPPGTAKSALIQELGRRLGGRVFDYLLTRFTEPNELFGPFDIRRLREGDLVTNTEGMLPEADFVFLDELLNANSAILNSLLTALNERVFRRGRETRRLPALMFVGASNHLPEEQALVALFDRFLVRVRCDNVAQEQLSEVLRAGWEFEHRGDAAPPVFQMEQLHLLQRQVSQVDVVTVRPMYTELVHRLRHAGMTVSDRRAVKYQRLIAASALLCGRHVAQPSDLWVLRYTWDLEEQEQVLATLVQRTIDEFAGQQQAPGVDAAGAQRHPRSFAEPVVDAELLSRDLIRISNRFRDSGGESDRVYLRDQLSIICSRVEWVPDGVARDALQGRIEQLWSELADPQLTP